MTHTSKSIMKFHVVALLMSWSIAFTANGQCEVAQLASQGGYGKVSVSGDVAVISDMEAFESQGAAFVYRRGPAGPEDWQLDAVLMLPEPDVEDSFGSSVAVKGDVIVVGADKTYAPEAQSGAAHVFRYDPDSAQWEYEAILIASDSNSYANFGKSVDVDGDTVIIGARDDDNNGLDNSGSAYIFIYNGREWIEETKLSDPNGEPHDMFGASVSIQGNVVLIGAYGNNHVWNLSGSAFVFRRDGLKWSLEQELADFEDPLVERFGSSVSLADGVALIGVPEDNSTPKGNDAGSAYIYRFDGSSWIEEQKITASDAAPHDRFGLSVSISDDSNTVLIGAPNDGGGGFASGSVYVLRYSLGSWQEVTKLLASDGAQGDDFGRSISASQDIALAMGGGKGYIFAGMLGIDCNNNGQPDTCDIFGGGSNDQNNNSIPDECDSDLDGNGTVNINDLLILFSNWGACDKCKLPGDCPADLDGDCSVGTSDILILFSNWG